MTWKFALAILVIVVGGRPVAALAQQPARPAPAQEAQTAGYNATYCAGFISENPLNEGLRVAAGEESGAKTQFVSGDIVYLNVGAGWIVNPGGEYAVLRRVQDMVRREVFPGQYLRLLQLGLMYQEVGRLRVNMVRPGSATATVLHTCDAVSVGDVCIPFNTKQEPLIQTGRRLDMFAPPSGKTTGTIVAGKGFTMLLGQRDVVYLDIGGKEGVTLGQYYRVYRPFDRPNDLFQKASMQYPTHIASLQVSPRLTPLQQKELPRDILGELVIIHVEGKSATGLITSIRRPIVVGDYVELQ